MLVPCDGHLKGLIKKFGTIVRHQVSKQDGLCGVLCHLDIQLVNDWWERNGRGTMGGPHANDDPK